MSAHRTIRPTLALTLALAALAGCGDGGPAAPADAVDTAPPAVPTGLTATFAPDAVKLRWDPNTTDADLAGYRVYELASGGAYALTAEPLTRTWWADPQPPGRPCQYAVTAVDASGNESAWLTVAYPGSPALPDREDTGR